MDTASVPSYIFLGITVPFMLYAVAQLIHGLWEEFAKKK